MKLRPTGDVRWSLSAAASRVVSLVTSGGVVDLVVGSMSGRIWTSHNPSTTCRLALRSDHDAMAIAVCDAAHPLVLSLSDQVPGSRADLFHGVDQGQPRPVCETGFQSSHRRSKGTSGGRTRRRHGTE